MNEITDLWHKIKGHLSKREMMALYDQAVRVEGNIVEIGSYQGLSTIVMAKGLQRNGHGGYIYAIDPHASYIDVSDVDRSFSTEYGPTDMEAFLGNLCIHSVTNKVFPIALRSQDVTLPFEFSMLFIDGLHTYEQVKNEVLTIGAQLPHDGLLLMHDSKWGGPKEVIYDLVEDMGIYYIQDRVDSLTILRKY